MAMKLNIIIGSTRPGRIGPKVATWLEGVARDQSAFDTVLVDLVDFGLPVYDEPKHPRMQDYVHEHTKTWAAAIAPADAYVFVTPEYNYFPPSSLINALTYLSREWAYKPAGVVSYGGISGGLRATQELRLLATTLRMMPIPETVPVPLVHSMIDAEKGFVPSEAIAGGAKLMLDELHKWAQALAPMRQG
ncbi:NADPH-dependent FMN reductase [Mesorhizobium sp. CAU 1741]|uniref:NADPH-dependent FMN reductase n=1 Tax=Mesorhizobium sp. CAU 1741 TaxID=3140366 RepID=UPI00325ABF7D